VAIGGGQLQTEISPPTTTAHCTPPKMSAICALRRMYATKATEQSLKVVATVPIAQSETVLKVPSTDSKAEHGSTSDLASSSSSAVPTPFKPLNIPAALARQRSTPQSVRLRRIKANRDQLKTGLTTSEQDRWLRLSLTGQNKMNIDEWTRRLYEQRSRIRGLKALTPQEAASDPLPAGTIDIGEGMGYGRGLVRMIGNRIYLPNFPIIFKENKTPKGEPYNPYVATFEIPRSITKNDLRSYLYFAYGVKTTWIRTLNFQGPIERATRKRQRGETYKVARVGLVDPFYYPKMIEDMAAEEREGYLKDLEENFELKKTEHGRKFEQYMVQKMSRGPQSITKKEFKPGLIASRKAILKKVMEKRKEREKMISSEVEKMLSRGEGRAIITS
jgi:large subunit ribosomal protein L23